MDYNFVAIDMPEDSLGFVHGQGNINLANATHEFPILEELKKRLLNDENVARIIYYIKHYQANDILGKRTDGVVVVAPGDYFLGEPDDANPDAD